MTARELRNRERCVGPSGAPRNAGVQGGTESSNLLWLRRESANFRFPSGPFWLIRVDAPKTREGFAHIAAVRREEVVRFIEGISIFALPTATGCAVCIACRPLAAGLALHRGR